MEKREATAFEGFMAMSGVWTFIILVGISIVVFVQYGFLAGMFNIAALTGFLFIAMYLEGIRNKLEIILEKEEQKKDEDLVSEEIETSLAEKN